MQSQDSRPHQAGGFQQQGMPQQPVPPNGSYGWANNGGNGNVPYQGGGGQYDVMMPQPTYEGGLPQPVRQPMPGSSTAAGFAGSKAFRSGIASVLWLLFGWIIVIGPVVAFFKGLAAVIRGIRELVRSAFVGGFGTVAAIVGIVLGLVGGGVSGTGMFLFGRAVYVIVQADMSDRHIDLGSDEAISDLLWRGEARYLSDEEYYGYDDGGYADGTTIGSDATEAPDVTGAGTDG